jgi:hypothetical protein
MNTNAPAAPSGRERHPGGMGRDVPMASRGAGAVPAPRSPADTFPWTVRGASADGRQWELVVDRDCVTAVTSAGSVAEARVSERDELVVLDFWAEEPGLPTELSADLVTQAFALPAVRLRRPVLVCVPQRSGAVLAHVRQHVGDARARSAGVTCFLEGRVRAGTAVPPTSSPLPR